MGLYPIPWREIYTYGQFFNLSSDQMEDLLFYMRRMDEAWINYFDKKKKNEQHKSPIGKPPRLRKK